MLTALESFLNMKTSNENIHQEKNKQSDEMEISECSRKIVNTNTKINTTMANFFAPLPIITTSSCVDPIPPKNIDNDVAMEDIKPHSTMTSLTTKNSDVWYIARYGRIYKRKAPSKVGYSHIPCPPGHRYCKECKKPIPLDKFYTNVKRYICRHHHYLRVNKRFRERVLTSDYEKMAEIAWLDLFRLCPMLGYAKADYDRHDIKDLVINTKIPLSVAPRAVPIDPSIPMRPRNVAIVSSANMSILLKVFVMSCSRAQYILLVQSCNLLPTNADAGVPWAPYHNPNYIRQDIDVVPILEKEKTMPKELPHVEAVWELMKEDEDKLHKCKSRLGRDSSDMKNDEEEESSDQENSSDTSNNKIYVQPKTTTAKDKISKKTVVSSCHESDSERESSDS